MYQSSCSALLKGMRLLVVIASVLLLVGCSSGSGEHRAAPKTAATTADAVASLPACSTTWTLAAKVTMTQARASCQHDGQAFAPEMHVCDPATHEGVAVALITGPDSRYAVFVDPDTTTEVDDGTGTGDYRDEATVDQQLARC